MNCRRWLLLTEIDIEIERLEDAIDESLCYEQEVQIYEGRLRVLKALRDEYKLLLEQE